MNERDAFSNFVIEGDQAGSALAVFKLRTPAWRVEMRPDGTTIRVEEFETCFDERSLRTRIENLKCQGLDASLSEAALQALERAIGAEARGIPRGTTGAALPAAPAAFHLGPVAEMTHDIVLVTAAGPDPAEPVIAYVNPAFTRLTGYAPEEVVGNRLRMLHGPGTSTETVAAIHAAIAAGTSVQDRVLLYPKSGRPLWFDLHATPLPAQADASLAHSAVVGRLVHPVGRGALALGSITLRDELTGLPHRQVLLDAIETELRTPHGPRRRGPCLAWFSLDGFAEMEARFGRAVGDAILLGVADRLAENVRRADLVCRLDGPEFVIYMDGIGLRDAEAGAARLHRVVASSPIETSQGPLPVAVRVGVAEARWQGEEAEPTSVLAAMLESARSAMALSVTEHARVAVPHTTY